MRSRTAVVVTLLAAAPLLLPTTPTVAAPVPQHSVTVTGPGTSLTPAYDAGVGRFAVGTSAATDGRLTLTAGTADPDGTVLVDGQPVANGAETTVEGLATGDEVNVQITDSAGTSNQSFLYLPAGFPRLTAASSAGGPADGMVFLGLGSYLSETSYVTAVDRNGVPVYVATAPRGHDFKPSGANPKRYTVAHLRPGSTNDDAGYRIDELGGRFQQLRSFTLHRVKSMGLRPDDTDFHDVELTDDGRVVLVGYQRRERKNGRTWLDSVIQITDRKGRPQFTWSSKGHIKPRHAYVLGSRDWDYAHLNSVEMQPNGDILASFRNVGQVLRIATRRHHGYRPGQVIWRLGGHRNQFTFVDDPYGGICAQHDARILPNGHLMLFDNGSQARTDGAGAPQMADMCPDPADPDGPRIERPQSRVVEYALDPKARTATLEWSHEVPGRYAAFAGNAQRLAGGHTLVGWSNSENLADPEVAPPFVSEVSPAGAEVWSLTAQGWFSYRAHKGDVADRTRPRAQIAFPADGAVLEAGQEATAAFSCTDRGGSNLDTCVGSQPNGAPLDTSPGAHSLRVTATDRAGNTRTSTVTYDVR